jgi:hypothetical protein
MTDAPTPRVSTAAPRGRGLDTALSRPSETGTTSVIWGWRRCKSRGEEGVISNTQRKKLPNAVCPLIASALAERPAVNTYIGKVVWSIMQVGLPDRKLLVYSTGQEIPHF